MKREIFEKACDIDRELTHVKREIDYIKMCIRYAVKMMKSGSKLDIKLDGIEYELLQMTIEEAGIIKHLGEKYRKIYCQLRDLKKQFDNLK